MRWPLPHRASLPLWCVVLLLLSVPPSWGQQELRSGKKGASVPAPVTSTPIDADTEALDVNCVQGCSGSPGSSDGAIVDGVSAAIKATVFDRTNSNPVATQLVDSNGDPVSVGGGTQYNQGTAATDTDALTMAGCVRSDTPAVATGVIDGDRARCIVDSTGRLWVHVGVVDGTISAIQSGAWNVGQSGAWTVTANAGTGNFTVVQPTGSNLHIVCDSGCSSSAGFADNSAFTFGTTAINPIGGVLDDTATNAATENSAAVARITAQKALHTNLRNNSGTEVGTAGSPLRVDPTGSTTQPVSGTVTANAGSGTFFDGIIRDGTGDTTQANVSSGNLHVNLQTALPAGTNNIGDVDVLSLPALPAGNNNIGDVDIASLPNEGTQTAANSISVTIASDIATGATTIPTAAQQGLVVRQPISCPNYVAISQTADTAVITATASQYVYICSIILVAGAAETVSIWEGTGTACGTGSTALAGSITEANGMSIAATGGFTAISPVPFVRTASTNVDLCIRQVGTNRVSGMITYIKAP